MNEIVGKSGLAISLDKSNFNVVKRLILLKIVKMVDISVELLHCFLNFLIEKLQVEPLRWQINLQSKMKIFLTKNEELHKPIRIKKTQEKKETSNFYRQYLGC